MNPVRKDRLERHALLMLMAAACGHVGNYIFHTLTGRMLSLQDYGLMVAVLGALHMLHLPLTAFNMAVAQHAAAHPRQTRALLIQGTGIALGISALTALILGFARSPLLAFFSSTRQILIPLCAMLIALSLLLTLTGGILQGHQKFRWLGARSLTLFLVRALLCLILLLTLAPRAETALTAHLLAMLVTLVLSLVGILAFLPALPSDPFNKAGYLSLFAQTVKALPALAGFAILMSADVVLVRRFFPPETSGRFAQAAVLARMVLWLPLPIASAMYPKVIQPGTDANHTLRKAVAYTLLLLSLTLLGFWLTTGLLLNILYGTSTPELIFWSRRMALAMAPLAFTHLLLQFELAQKRFAGSAALLLTAAGYLLAAALRHPDIPALINTLMIATLLSAILLLLLLQRRRA